MKWVELTSPQLGAIDKSTPVLLSIGAIEQHGAHLPVETDALIGRYFSERLDQRLGDNLLVIPQLSICCSRHHMDFPGTLTVKHETFLAYVTDVLEAVVAHGFRKVIILNSHGGNLGVAQVLLERFGMDHPEIDLFTMTWWNVVREQLLDIQESECGGVGHACEFETSLVQHIAPELVDGSKIKDQLPVFKYHWAGGDMLHAGKAMHHRTMGELTDGTGTFGRPSMASAEKGARIADSVTDALCAIVGDIIEDREAD